MSPLSRIRGCGHPSQIVVRIARHELHRCRAGKGQPVGSVRQLQIQGSPLHIDLRCKVLFVELTGVVMTTGEVLVRRGIARPAIATTTAIDSAITIHLPVPDLAGDEPGTARDPMGRLAFERDVPDSQSVGGVLVGRGLAGGADWDGLNVGSNGRLVAEGCSRGAVWASRVRNSLTPSAPAGVEPPARGHPPGHSATTTCDGVERPSSSFTFVDLPATFGSSSVIGAVLRQLDNEIVVRTSNRLKID